MTTFSKKVLCETESRRLRLTVDKEPGQYLRMTLAEFEIDPSDTKWEKHILHVSYHRIVAEQAITRITDRAIDAFCARNLPLAEELAKQWLDRQSPRVGAESEIG